MNDENPYAPPQASLARPLGSHRYYGVLIGNVKFSEIRKLTRNPLTWIRLAISRWTGHSRAVIVSGAVNPQSPTELQMASLPTHIRERLATKHNVLSENGFRWIGYYRSPSLGAAQMVGELWLDDQNVACLNLLLQTLSYPRATLVQEHFTLFSPIADQTGLYTTTNPISLAQIAGQETLRLPGSTLAEIIRRHRERLNDMPAKHLPPTDWLTSDRVWTYLLENLQAEIRGLEAVGVVSPLSETQVRKLNSFNVCLDFRERRVPWRVRIITSMPLALYALLIGMLCVIWRWPIARILMYRGLIWLCLTLFSNQLIYRFLRAKPEDQLPPRVS
jgi:hypothetical protein